MTYSLDIRKKVLEVRSRDGLCFAAVAVLFNINQSSVVRLTKEIVSKKHRNKAATTINMDLLKKINTWLNLVSVNSPQIPSLREAQRRSNPEVRRHIFLD